MEYQVAHAPSLGSLEKIVNDMIVGMWMPIGGVSVSQTELSSSNTYYQAMLRFPEDDITTSPIGR